MSWILTHAYDATKKSEYLRNAINIWRQDILRLGSTPSIRVAELYWNIGKAQDLLSEYTESSESFKKASLFYLQEAEKKPKVAAFYRDYSRYMEAWAEFERAKQAHMDKNYLGAKDHYQSIASIFESTERWSYLAHNYRAWASLEEAEAHSMRESPQDAIDSFRRAIELFEESRASVQTKLDEFEEYEKENRDIIKSITQLNEKQESASSELTKDVEEKENLTRILRSYSVRREYCLGRIALEEAVILKKRGDLRDSSRKYGEAANIFSNTLSGHEDVSLEVQPFHCISQAWQYLTQAEAEASPDKYNEAIKLFEKVKDNCSDEKTKRIIQGHTFFCRALEASTRFDDTRDSKYLSEALESFENAANTYQRVKLLEASEYAKANQRLLEAYGYMGRASKETEPQNKAALYSMAEKLLENAAKALSDSGYKDKSDEINLMLGRVRKEREVSISLSSMYSVPSVISPSQTYPVPLPTIESPTGLEKFEDAEIQSSSLISNRQCRIGEQVEIDIEVMNVGKGKATLLKIEPMQFDGLRIKKVPAWSRLEDTSLNLRNKVLETQGVEDIKLTAAPYVKGEYHLRPRILYRNDSGEISSHMISLEAITVKELGISDWIKGASRTRKD